ncbi:hypothetical protein RIF29_17395 [Crotalaria pallida]|uniref:Neprosin PEP catalytic domain-containing protein n=1 Tax=Crotalaria pallida TaxID=3830 RepID=A0AAN9FGY6_CROPI
MCLASASDTPRADGLQPEENLELERQLKLINKLPVQSFHTKFGYIVDCIDINKQPAFDNPLLKNHKLQEAKVYLVSAPGNPYYAVSGTNSVYNPRVNKDQTSSSHIWVQNGEGDGTNKIMVGWHTGCYNFGCSGFVQNYDTVGLTALGEIVDTSVINGKTHEITLSLKQDAKTKNWWLYYMGTPLGYYPSELFTNLTSADQVGWGGKTTTAVGTPTPPMGSGLFPDGNLVHASYFRNVAIQNQSRVDYGPQKDGSLLKTFTDKPKCFGVQYYGDQGGDVGYSLQFGGPGGDCDN